MHRSCASPCVLALALAAGLAMSVACRQQAGAGPSVPAADAPEVPGCPYASDASGDDPWLVIDVGELGDRLADLQAGICDGGAPAPTIVDERARDMFLHGLQADTEGRLDDCMSLDRAGIEIDPSPRAVLHLASCETRSGKLCDGFRDARRAVIGGREQCDPAVYRAARNRLRSLHERIPGVLVSAERRGDVTFLAIDDVRVPTELLDQRVRIDPGKHSISICARNHGVVRARRDVVSVRERDLVTVAVP